jgi:hypothetical protein
MKKRFHLLAVLFGSAALVVAGCCPQNPPLDSAIAAHGNTDWHIDTAEEFLFGTDMGGVATAPNHCPGAWTRRHMHVDMVNTNHFYYDEDCTVPGDDKDAADGIDQAMLFFYAGHGNPTLWNTLGNNATQSNLCLGDCPGSGLLRYYWQCSCQVFAHGPRNCAGSTHAYACPGDFDGSPDSPDMRNVYERWGPALDPDLRMACGASTSAFCHESQMNRIWDNYNNLGSDVADSFIVGLRGSSWVVPLCITIGGDDPGSTPLHDATFTNQPNTSGTSHYHIQYLSHFASTPRESPLIPPIPELLPILEVGALPLPRMLRDVEFEAKEEMMLSSDEVGDRGPRVQVSRSSGAVYIRGERKLGLGDSGLGEDEYIERALRFIDEQGWAERDFAEPVGVRLMIEMMPVDGEEGKQQEFQKNVIVTLKRQIEVDGLLVNVVGEGGNASKVWREVASARQQVRVKTYEEAYEEALRQIENPQAYEIDDWTWGYKEAAGSVEQTEMRIVFQFWFVPADPETLLEYPPRMIEIPGQSM